jgi:serine/threonine-protein phosphatase 2B regulatory subunit
MEVKEMLMSLMQENTSLELTEDQVDAIVNQTFEEADINKDGKIDQTEWQAMVKQHPGTLSKMTLPQLKDISTQFPSFVFNSKVDDWQDASVRRGNANRTSR